MTQCGSRLFCLQWRLRLCQWVSSACLSVKISWIPLSYLETERNIHLGPYLYGYCVYNQLQNKSHRCQCKQMHGNYFRITTALCHLTAVLFKSVHICQCQHRRLVSKCGPMCLRLRHRMTQIWPKLCQSYCRNRIGAILSVIVFNQVIWYLVCLCVRLWVINRRL